ncbi:MAG TPA: 4-hydroxy-tetrahydrodipicolinate synthase [Thermoanaerobaculia bacterium]|jgi:4-hydroxy-tetrahydrodipicolinate synthase|nr:4-hydroxy-tetrahydrodipicolinate synthase [Thermoanaerobaculia bacterium]
MFQGCGTALVTPFRSDLSLDEEGLRRLVRRQIEGGIHFLVPCGTTGENPTLTREEHLRVVEITLEEAGGKTPVLAGCGGNDTQEVVELARDLEGLGADGLLVVTPYYNKPTPEGLFQHYRAVARATRLPIVVYNVPGRTGSNVDPATLARLAEIETVVGVKEASGNISQMAAIFQIVPESFAVLSGDDAITLPLIALGGVGIISVVSNEVPFAMARLTSLCLEGDFPAAREMQRRLHALMEINFIEANPGPVKAALALMGLIEPVFRLPMVPPKEENLKKIEKILLGLGLIPENAESESDTAVETRLAG